MDRTGAGSAWLAIRTDQRDIGAIRAAAARIERELGGPDMVFANAGIQAFTKVRKRYGDDRARVPEPRSGRDGTA